MCVLEVRAETHQGTIPIDKGTLYLYQAREPSERTSTDSTREASAEVAEVRPRS
jgi:hypothetical protein